MSKSDKIFTFCSIAGWNEYVREHYSIAQDALWLCFFCQLEIGIPTVSLIYLQDN